MYIPNETSYIVRKDLQTCPPILLQSIFLAIIITNKTSSLLDTLPYPTGSLLVNSPNYKKPAIKSYKLSKEYLELLLSKS